MRIKEARIKGHRKSDDLFLLRFLCVRSIGSNESNKEQGVAWLTKKPFERNLFFLCDVVVAWPHISCFGTQSSTRKSDI
jgi:hypothetical protein